MPDIKINITENGNVKKCSIILCVRTLFHIVSVCLFWSVACYGISIFFSIPEKLLADPLVDMVKRFMPLYLTNWNFSFQTIFLTMSMVYDVMEWREKHETSVGKKLKYYRDILFSGAVVPATLFISTMFWTVYWIDRELVFPKVYDQIIPWWFNHCVHTNIAIVLLVETVLQERRHPTNKKIELYLNGFIGVFYAIVYYSIYLFANRWLYGVFGIMNWWQVCLYQIMIWTSMAVFYFIQFPINRIFHREPVIEQKNGTSDVQNGIVETKRNPETDTTGDLKSRTREMENSNL